MFGRRPRWPKVDEAALCERLSQGGKVLDAGQRRALDRLLRPGTEAVYLWGQVGRGKTWMADAFHGLVPGHSMTLHLHRFLAKLHREITRRQRPFDAALNELLGPARFLYLDEFHLHDVADAHLMRRTLAAARRSGISLLMTSNYAPEGLLPNPLYHHHAVPLIEQITTTAAVIRIDDGTDYRGQHGASARGFTSGHWQVRPPRQREQPSSGVELGARRWLPAYTAADGALEVSFSALCEEPLSAADYAALAEQFTVLCLQDVPAPDEISEEPMQRFAFLIDVLVSADIRCEISAATPLETWKDSSALPRDADRLLSRLSLLQSGR